MMSCPAICELPSRIPNISIFSLDYRTPEGHNFSNRLSEEQFPPEGEGSAPFPEAIAPVGRRAALQPTITAIVRKKAG
jgi:hypothetical protein